MGVRRTFLLLAVTAALGVPGGASAADSGGAEVPLTARQVAEGGGATPPKPKPAKPKRKRKPATPKSNRAKPKPVKRAPVERAPAGPGLHFPIRGAFSWGGSDSRFGAPRSGHTHQGQDLTAAEGTPVVAPSSGTVQTVAYQATGAGHYVVLDGAGEDRDYVFMHLRSGSVVVREGQRVRRGAFLGEVGNTGRSFGAHLHFEIWVAGGWYSGGHPIDPLPLLRSWARR